MKSDLPPASGGLPCLQSMQRKQGKPDNHQLLNGGSDPAIYGHHIMPGKRPSRTLTVRIDAAIAEQARSFARDQAGKPLYLSLSKLTSQALVNEIRRLEAELSAGSERGRSLTSSEVSRNHRSSIPNHPSR